jgi:hypothetical protein
MPPNIWVLRWNRTSPTMIRMSRYREWYKTPRSSSTTWYARPTQGCTSNHWQVLEVPEELWCTLHCKTKVVHWFVPPRSATTAIAEISCGGQIARLQMPRGELTKVMSELRFPQLSRPGTVGVGSLIPAVQSSTSSGTKSTSLQSYMWSLLLPLEGQHNARLSPKQQCKITGCGVNRRTSRRVHGDYAGRHDHCECRPAKHLAPTVNARFKAYVDDQWVLAPTAPPYPTPHTTLRL